MTNLFNSRGGWSPEGRNLLNSSGWEDASHLDSRPDRDSAQAASPLSVGYNRRQQSGAVEYAAAYDDEIPTFKPGEVSSAPEQPLPRRAGPPAVLSAESGGIPGLARKLWAEVTGEGRSEAGIPELPPWIKVNGRDNAGYSKVALARDNMAAAQEIALKQFPGSSVRNDAWGNPILKLPDGAARATWRVTGVDAQGSPIVEAEDTPVSGEFYLNRPGISHRDIANEAVNAVFTGVGGGVGALAGGAAGMPIAGAGMGAALGSEAMDAAAQQAGSTQGIQWGDMIGAGAKSTGWRTLKTLVGR